MDRQAERARKPFGLRAYLLLVLAVLAGVLAMHGLGPAAAVTGGAHATASHHTVPPGHATAITASDALGHEGCTHAGDPAGGGGGHAEHADATCAATGTAGAPVLPAPAVLPGHGTQAVLAHGVIPGAAACGRAPPSLSELQLLRI